MAIDDIKELYTPKHNDFYRNHYHHVLIGLIVLIVCVLIVFCVVFYQVMHRPLPQFNAVQQNGKTMILIPTNEPNLLPDTILRWASKAAVAAYTFNFDNYKQQIAAARPYFTDDGWQNYLSSVNNAIQ